MRITMLETRRATEDGQVIKLYREGESYEVPDHLARFFLAAGYAR